MKKLCLTSVIAVFLLFLSSGIQGQTTQPQLDQLKLAQLYNGNFQADHGKDTIEIWESKPYGKANIVNVSWNIKDQKTPLYINNVSFNSKEGKFYGFVLWPSGDKGTWIGSYVSEKKFNGENCINFDPAKVSGKFEMIYESPSAFTWRQINMNGAIVRELKFKKVK